MDSLRELDTEVQRLTLEYQQAMLQATKQYEEGLRAAHMRYAARLTEVVRDISPMIRVG